LRQRVLDHGLKTDASGDRILFPPDELDNAVSILDAVRAEISATSRE
jgi:hypothetical protein